MAITSLIFYPATKGEAGTWPMVYRERIKFSSAGTDKSNLIAGSH
jgi:hypothetical protein